MVHQLSDNLNMYKRAFATIVVTYEAGLRCRCSNGSTILEAENQIGGYMFAVPSGGDWTVTVYSEDGEHEKSHTVEAVQEGMAYRVKISLRTVVVPLIGLGSVPYVATRAKYSESPTIMGLKIFTHTQNNHCYLHIGPIAVNGGRLCISVPNWKSEPYYIDGKGLKSTFGGCGFGVSGRIYTPETYDQDVYVATKRFIHNSYSGYIHKLSLDGIVGDFYVVLDMEGTSNTQITNEINFGEIYIEV